MFTVEERVHMVMGLLDAGIAATMEYRMNNNRPENEQFKLSNFKLSLDTITMATVRDLTALVEEAERVIAKRKITTPSNISYTSTSGATPTLHLMDVDRRLRNCLTVIENITMRKGFLDIDPVDDMDALWICKVHLESVRTFIHALQF